MHPQTIKILFSQKHVTRSAKTQHNGIFFIYNLLSQMYALAKFQPRMPITFGVTVVTIDRSIRTASIGKIKYRRL